MNLPAALAANKKAFTLIEILLLVAIMLIMARMSTPLYSRFLTQNNVANVADQLAGQMRKAQIYAMEGKQNGNWGVAVNGGNIVLFQGTSFAARNAVFDERFLLNSNITVSGFTEIVYARMTGLPSTTPTINIQGNGSTKTISVNSQGVVNK